MARIELFDTLTAMSDFGKTPTIKAYNRIDGPGSSLDLREFQQAFWTLPNRPDPGDKAGNWTQSLPRTVAMTIDVGTRVIAEPLQSGQIGIVSHEYNYEEQLPAGTVPFKSKYWLLKIIDLFNLSGVQFTVQNLISGTHSSGLGGSATAATAVCLLANRLAGFPYEGDQIVAMASIIEQDMGVSITGTQEQANVVYGGVTDYVWFPWGIPYGSGMYGSSLRYKLLAEEQFGELAGRIRIYHSGVERASTDVNKVWRDRLEDKEGFLLHKSQLETAFTFREGIRLQNWTTALSSVKKYREVRTELCAAYMVEECHDIQRRCEKYGVESFPLGAGGGGAVLLFSDGPEKFDSLDEELGGANYRNIKFSLKSKGHEFDDEQ